jgi:mannosyltransferase OCH1-like enzyme
MTIPKIIHQTYKTETIPPKWESAQQSVLRNNPTFTYMFWTDADIWAFMKAYFPDYGSLFMSYIYDIQRVDAFRYFVLYTYGGIYMDLDIGCNSSLERFLDNDLVLPESFNVSHFYTNSLMMCNIHNPIMLKCMEGLYESSTRHERFGQHLHIMHSTGPSYLTSIVEKTESITSFHIIPLSVFSGDCTACNLKTCSGGKVFFHVTGGSWHGVDSTIFNAILCNRIEIILFILSVCFYRKLSKQF